MSGYLVTVNNITYDELLHNWHGGTSLFIRDCFVDSLLCKKMGGGGAKRAKQSLKSMVVLINKISKYHN